MKKVTTFLFKIADVLAFLFLIGGLISILHLPFSEVEHLYQAYKGWEPSWLGILFYAMNSIVMGIASYLFLRRRIRVFTVLAITSAICTMSIQGVSAGLWLIGFVLLMLMPCYLAKRGTSQNA
ncbi:hypothetical protein MED92_13101 [Oceanospirillum sp. MED92]|uniref:Uncharacterized protein n=1 Tax=Neptuniibacter caesariensis TaxID=207954 RepID=A0A7U8C4U7_NEPCE|nr:hypothetical protein MED92_13101 [Oceanospirillum sp. MED92] [Neptuniibacter caesariensis]